IKNYKSGHDFERIIGKIAEAFGLLAYEIKVMQGDHRIDLIVTYKEKLILVQCKNTETSISVQIVQGKIATPRAKHWVQTSKRNIKICNEDQFVGIIKNFYKSNNDNYVELVNLKADSFNVLSLLGENFNTEQIFLFVNFKTIAYKMSKLFDEQTQELARLNALKIQLEELEEFDFKYYKTEFKTSKKKIMRIINYKLDP
ncbi:24171_t:CDS:2, partial [Cetraspora pellucida]